MQARRVHTQNDWNSIRSLLSSRMGTVQSRCYPACEDRTQRPMMTIIIIFQSSALQQTAVLCWLRPYHNSSSVVLLGLNSGLWRFTTGPWIQNHNVMYMYSSHVNGCHLPLRLRKWYHKMPILAILASSLPFQTETAKLNNQIEPTQPSPILLLSNLFFNSDLASHQPMTWKRPHKASVSRKVEQDLPKVSLPLWSILLTISTREGNASASLG